MKIKSIDYLAMLLLLVSPILGIYGNPDGWNYETLMVLPISFLYFVSVFMSRGGINEKKDLLPQGLVGYFIYWGVLLLVMSASIPKIVIQAYLAFFLFFSTFHLKTFIRLYRLFAFTCIVFFFVQDTSYIVTGTRISGIISSLPIYNGISTTDAIAAQAMAMRSCSFFSEPAHFAQFLLPLLAIELFYAKGKIHYIMAAIIVATILLLRSGNGLVGMVAILAFALPYYMKSSKKTRFFSFVLFALVVGFTGYYYFNSEMGETLLGRQVELSSTWDGQSSRSGFLRLWRGFYVYGDYNIFEKIFGCPNDTDQLKHVFSSHMMMVAEAELYFNAFQKILLNTGIIGVVCFVYIIAKIWRGNNYCGKAILSSLVAISFVAAIYMSHTMILFLVFAYSLKKDCRITNGISPKAIRKERYNV